MSLLRHSYVTPCAGGVLYVPPGTYKLTRASQVYSKAIIIRGAGLNRTTLYYPNSFAVRTKPAEQLLSRPAQLNMSHHIM